MKVYKTDCDCYVLLDKSSDICKIIEENEKLRKENKELKELSQIMTDVIANLTIKDDLKDLKTNYQKPTEMEFLEECKRFTNWWADNPKCLTINVKIGKDDKPSGD